MLPCLLNSWVLLQETPKMLPKVGRRCREGFRHSEDPRRSLGNVLRRGKKKRGCYENIDSLTFCPLATQP